MDFCLRAQQFIIHFQEWENFHSTGRNLEQTPAIISWWWGEGGGGKGVSSESWKRQSVKRLLLMSTGINIVVATVSDPRDVC